MLGLGSHSPGVALPRQNTEVLIFATMALYQCSRQMFIINW